MTILVAAKEQLLNIYAKYSIVIDRALQFVLAFLTFNYINKNIGFMELASKPIVTLALAIICTLLPIVFTVVFAAALMLAHMYAVSLALLIVVALIYIMMFCFYFRFTPSRGMVVLLVGLSFIYKVPVVIPLVFGLIGSPVYIIPVAFGTIVYYMMDFVLTSKDAILAADGLLGQLTFCAQQILNNKELWVILVAFTITLLIVNLLRRLSMNHSWEFAIIMGAISYFMSMVLGAITFNLTTEYGSLIGGALLAVVVALILEFMVFSVDYRKTEYIQYEDDEYYYYVKAIPKIIIEEVVESPVRGKGQRQFDHNDEYEEMDEEESSGRRRKKPAGNRQAEQTGAPVRKKKPAFQGRTPEEILLEKSLKKEFDLNDDNESE